MWLDTKLCALLKIKYPILQAPMAITTTPALAAAVAEAGGLGALGCAVLSAKEIEQQVVRYRELTGGRFPIHLNFFVHERPKRDAARDSHARKLVQRFYDDYKAGAAPEPHEPFLPLSSEIADVVIALRVEIVSFHFGIPPRDTLQRFKKAGITLMSSATTVEEAKYLEQAGIDVLIAQGWEAGGHRGTFLGSHDAGTVGTIALVPQMVDAVDVPVVAAGGIADGRGVLAALALGASGVQLGTAFLQCPEANVTEPHRQILRTAAESDTRITRAFSGRPARSLRNRYLDGLAEHDLELPDFPLMNPLSKPLRVASEAAGVPDCLPLWCGQGVRLTRPQSARDVVTILVAQVERLTTTMRSGKIAAA